MAGLNWRCLAAATGLLAACLWLTAPGWALELGKADISLRSSNEYRLQWSDSPAAFMTVDEDRDQDFFTTLSTEVKWREAGLTFAAMASYAKDLDGTRQGSIFQDYTDSRGSHRQDFECYYAYVEKADFLVRGLDLKAGRQYAYGAETVHFDGLAATYANPAWLGLEAEAFGGRAVQHYSDPASADGIGGANLSIRPLPGLALDLNAVIFEETSWEGAIFWQASDYWKLRGRLAFINDHTRFFDVGLEAVIPATGTVFDFSLYRRYAIASQADFLFDFTYTLDEALSAEINRLYLMSEEGYLEFDCRVSQPLPFLEGTTVFVRYTNRSLSHGDRENLYNTDFQRISTGFDLEEIFGWHGFHLGAGVSYWWEDRDIFYEGESTSWFADVSQELFERLKLSAGFHHKSEDVNSLLENQASTSWRLACEYQLCAFSSLELAYEYSEDDYYKDELGVDHFNSVSLKLDFTF
ncbi:MAG: hypothetical protein JXR89_04200 [Deltaproteobacteria bacterium]|nr:hypothetical protein [Deltaproteobacteria bacterium]